MARFEVKHGKITDVLGRVREGWFVLEDGRPGYPYKSKEEAERNMEAMKQIRHVSTREVIK